MQVDPGVLRHAGVSVKAPRETDVQRTLLDYLRLRRAAVVRVNSGATKAGGRFIRFNGTPGCSDILACYRGRFLALEVKRDGGSKATPEQEAFLAAVRAAGGVGAVVRSVADVDAVLAAIDTQCDEGDP